MSSPILVGAVIYDPKVALIWDIIKDFFHTEKCPIDYVFYSNYELMVDALLGKHIHIAWNSPLAWVDAERRTKNHCRALAMRDTDRDRVTHLVAKKGSGINNAGDLRGKRVAVGAKDSPQATLLPLHMLRGAGLQHGRDFEVRRFDLLVGKHGDHIGGEREALRCLETGEAHASAMLDLNWERWSTDGTIDPAKYGIVATTPPFDHCNFTVIDTFPEAEAKRWTETLFRMRYDNPAHREMMDMEGLKEWLPGRTSGYAALTKAAEEERFFGWSELPPFAVGTVGSWPRPRELLRALGKKQRGELDEASFQRLADEAVLASLRAQEEAGIDVVSDGEQRRDNFYSFVAEKLEGVQLMSLAEMLDVVEDKAGFRRILETLDVPAYSLKNPTCVGKLEPRRSLALDELEFLKRHTNRPIKVPLPGPYILTRAMWVKEVTRQVYASKEALAEDVVRILRDEVIALRNAGATVIQLDEPVLTELVFTQGQTRTFMCAALAARKDPEEELELAVDLINRVVDGLTGVTTAVHVCRGNWSQNESTLLEGSYAPLNPYLRRLDVDELVLEYATPRAGDLLVVEGKSLGLGVVNPRTPGVETPEQIVARVEEALRHLKPSQIRLNPDCGFGTFATRAMNTPEIATAKLKAMTEAARRLRDRWC